MAKPLQLLAFLFLLLTGTAALAAPRCTASPANQSQRITINDGVRSVLLHLPPGFDPARPAPLVILLHGSGGTGAAMLRDSNLAEAADRHGFIVAAPDAGIPHDQGFVWNIPGVPTVAGTIPGPDAPDDVKFIGALIDQLAKAGCADPARVYATGLSGGGRMTSWLGCVAADRFAAIAPVVGLRAGNPLASDPTRPDPATCRPSRPLPVIAFAGDADTTNPIQGGGAKYWSYTMHAAEMRWATLNDCTAAPTTRWVAPKVYEERYTGCRDGADVAGRITVGGGHSWVIDNDALWAFLSQHRR
ncbi:PHB depolymerase family esterase [Sphingomonas sp. ABOLH]|uniref:alpha/beta hydrolase family esterase n=1 Tax=Sphingomonas sp. ABOLH TaxID=1985881 RepID=UPI000F7F916E|nr:PHB depolymerase family esterase [Sphingomonas sp. ABOLH]RSV21581.1 polyhydroxybutyrate depolymerase [Sphingomonas sp. ABOLH]